MEVSPATTSESESINRLAGQEERFLAYTQIYRPVFRRQDQFVRFRTYLRGLLDGHPAKTAEAIAARQTGSSPSLGQALQHFVSSSPWDAERLLAVYRQVTAGARQDPAAVWVVLDLAFPKKGRQSAGAQRQFARPLNRKLNCQVAVAVARCGPGGCYPLAVRLYLPGNWLRDQAASVTDTIPPEHRTHRSKSEIACGLLTALRQELGAPAGVTGDVGYRNSLEFADLLRQANLSPAEDDPAVLRAARAFTWLENQLGLAGYEGRTWQGWHRHVALSLAAYGFVRTVNEGTGRAPFLPD